MTNTTDPRVEAVARVLADLAPTEEWPTNENLGGGLTGTRDDEYRHMHLEQAGEALAAADAVGALRKPRTITTAEELEALPDEAVVRSDFGVIHEKRVEFDTDRVFWVCPGDIDEHTAGKITLPATVLWEPEA